MKTRRRAGIVVAVAVLAGWVGAGLAAEESRKAVPETPWAEQEVEPLTLDEAKAAEKAFDDYAEYWEGPHVKELTSLDDLDAVVAASAERPLFLFKHSTACPISGRAAVRVDKYLAEKGDDAPEFAMVKVIEARPVSNAVAEKLGVEHESPQLLLLKDGKVLWTTSHGNITGENIEAALADHAAS